MDPNIQAILSQEDPAPGLEEFRNQTDVLVKMARREMAKHYSQWDQNDDIYRNRRNVDKDDISAAERREPVKMVVPLTYSQIQTFITFGLSLLTQRERFFELLPMAEGSEEPAKIGEAFLQRDLSKNVWETRLYQFLLDVARFGVGVIKIRWARESRMTITKDAMGVPRRTLAMSFLGNRLSNVSPYQFYPDPRLPMSRFQEGEFVAMEEVWPRHRLKQMQKDGEVAGVEFIPSIKKAMLEQRGTTRVYGLNPLTGSPLTLNEEDNSNVIVTECQRIIVPAETILNGTPLGAETYPMKYNLWIANDARLIKCEPLGYLHDEFTYTLAEYNPDVLNFTNSGLADSISLLQDAFSWFINSRITNVRKILSNRLIIDPSGVEMDDINERRPVIRVKTNVAKIGVDKFIKQLDLADVTGSHINDAGVLREFAQETTGVNETILGQPTSGRRSATENRNVVSSAAARLKMLFLLFYRNALEPMARQMLSNLRDGLDEQQIVRLTGPTRALAGGAQFVKADKTALIGEYDFEVFDGTIASEKGLNATALQEVLTAFISNPQAALALRIDPLKIFLEWLELRGVRNPQRFLLPGMPALPQQASGMGPSAEPAPGGATEGVSDFSLQSLLSSPPSGGGAGSEFGQ